MLIKMLFWEPGQVEARAHSVVDATEVAKLADDLLLRYPAAHLLPGIELRADTGDSLSVAVGQEGWALIHTNSEFTQYCTKKSGKDDNTSVDVRWEEVTSIPTMWFIPKALALAGLNQWFADGTRSPDLPWSNDCA